MASAEKVSIEEIRDIFVGLIEGEKSREEAAVWAHRLLNKNDQNRLVYSPPQHENLIRECMTYLTGVDMREHLDEEYLHLEDDFRDFYQTKINN